MLWNILVSIATVSAAIATIAYVVLTNRLLKETIKTRKEQNRPYVIVDLEIRRDVLVMVIKNIGNNSAIDVNVNVEPPINNPFLKMDFLAPSREISNTIRYLSNQDYDSPSIPKYKFTISYKDPYEENYNHEYSIDVIPLLNSNGQNDYDRELIDRLGKVKDELSKIKDDIHKIAGKK